MPDGATGKSVVNVRFHRTHGRNFVHVILFFGVEVFVVGKLPM